MANKLLFGGVRAESQYKNASGEDCSPEDAVTIHYFEYDENGNCVGSELIRTDKWWNN